MQVTRVETVVRADQVAAGDTFKYIPKSQKDFNDFLVIGNNGRFSVANVTSQKRVDQGTHVLVYNIGAKCWGIVPADTQVIATVAELVING
jgi:hypothetical protein